MKRRDLVRAASEREEERFARLRERRLEALTRVYREAMQSEAELEEITGEVQALAKKVSFLESVRTASLATKVAAIITALGGGAGVTELVRAIIAALR
jgi:phage antirepressor YoqD-like protein